MDSGEWKTDMTATIHSLGDRYVLKASRTISPQARDHVSQMPRAAFDDSRGHEPSSMTCSKFSWLLGLQFYGSFIGAWLVLGVPVYCLLAFFHLVPWWA